MKLKVIVAALSLSLIAVSTAEARGPYGSINVGNWKGGAYTTDKTGEFSHCAAGAAYDSGIYFMVIVDQGEQTTDEYSPQGHPGTGKGAGVSSRSPRGRSC